MNLLQDLHEAVVTGDDTLAVELTRRGLDDGYEPEALIDDAMVPAMAEAGRRFEAEEYFVPELLVAGRAIQAGLEVLRPLLAPGTARRSGCLLIGTVQGDLHDIGKNLVAVMFEGAGFEVVDLGTDVAPVEVVAAIDEHHPDVVALSALLTTTMLAMQATIEAIEDAGRRDEVIVMVGGAPLNEKRAKEFGADGYAENANAAVRLAVELMGARAGPAAP